MLPPPWYASTARSSPGVCERSDAVIILAKFGISALAGGIPHFLECLTSMGFGFIPVGDDLRPGDHAVAFRAISRERDLRGVEEARDRLRGDAKNRRGFA